MKRCDDEIGGERIEQGFLWEQMLGAGGALLEVLILKPWLRKVRPACEVVAVREEERKWWIFGG